MSVIPEPSSLNYELIPPDPSLINPDLALDAALAPVEDIATNLPKPFGRSWHFDFIEGQFEREGSIPKVVYELDSLVQWIEHAARTARRAHPIYQDSYGMDPPYAMIGMQPGEELLTVYQDNVKRALQFHDRILAVENFSFAQHPLSETMEASFTVVINAGAALQPQTMEFTGMPIGPGLDDVP